MRRWFAIFPVAAVVAAVLLILPADAVPATGPTTMMQDDDLLLYSTPQREVSTLNTFKALGVDVVKVTMSWWVIAPDNNSYTLPANFNPNDPSAYDGVDWARYDRLVQTAKQLGMKVYFQLAPPVPLWSADPHFQHKQGNSWSQIPRPNWWKAFVEAAGRRYSGSYHPSAGAPALPRVSTWGVWNEPNEFGWLGPWNRKVNGMTQELSAALYREIVDGAWKGLKSSGHGSDTFVIGETANFGTAYPVPFLENLYCVGWHFHVLRGKSAEKVDCPKSGNRSKFRKANPGLFHITDYSHHPYRFNGPPNRPDPSQPQWVTPHNLNWMEGVLKHIFARYGMSRPGGVPLYIDEFGYITHPPDHNKEAISLQKAALWLNDGEYAMSHDHFVKTIAQFLLKDPSGSPFACGLELPNGKPKPDMAAFRLPIWLPVTKHGNKVTVWGQLRPADHSTTAVGVIQFRPHGSSAWVPIDTVHTTNREGTFQVPVAIPKAGTVRLEWIDSSGKAYYSRHVSVS